MINITREFDKQIDEIEVYFNALKILDDGSCKITCRTIDNTTKEIEVDESLTRILKANAFLLLYNLIEATIRKSIEKVFFEVQTEGITFAQLSNQLKDIWIKQYAKKIKKSNLSSEKINESLNEIAQFVLKNELMKFEADSVNISGNIDAQKIRDFAKQIGFDQSSNGQNLLLIKEKRNKLAHGEFTFSEIGSNYSIQQLNDYKDEAKIYLEDVISKIGIYISNKNYKRIAV